MRKISYIDDFEQWKKEFSFYTEIKVRISETDLFGHVNNISALIYFEQARVEYLAETGAYQLNPNSEYAPIAADIQCDYIEQMYFGDMLRIYVKTNSIGNASIDLHYLGINQDDKVCLVGRGALVNIDLKTGKTARVPDDIREKLLGK